MILATSSTTANASAHLAHILEAGGGVFLTLLVVGVVDFLRGRDKTERPPRRPTMPRDGRVIACVIATIGAASVHLVVMPEHFQEATLYGLFFAATATAQLAYAGWLAYRPQRRLLLAGMIANGGLVVLWLFTRLVEVPLGPGAGATESFSGLDILASTFEACFVVAAALALWRVARRHAAWMARVFVPASLAMVAALVTVTAVRFPPS